MPVLNAKPNFDILKEPRGFIKLIELAIAIFAFSTTAGYHGHFEFKCNTNGKVSADFSYPFNTMKYYITKCNGTTGTRENSLDYQSESQYFVFVGVTCFLYIIGATLYYIFFDNQARDAASTDIGICNFVIVDFVATVVYVIFWFTCSIAWAAGLSGLKDSTNTGTSAAKFDLCKGISCSGSVEATYGALNVSVLLGFLNFLVWCFNIWFLFKETPWHSPRGGRGSVPPAGEPETVTQEIPPSSI